MMEKDTKTSTPQSTNIPCPKCHQPAGDVRPGDGRLEFKCKACGHQWMLFDRVPQRVSER